MKILCLIDSIVKPGDRWLWDYLPSNKDEIDFIFTSVPDKFPKWGKLFAYYPAYWQLAFRALKKTRRKHYDVVVAWEAKNGFPFAVLRRIMRIRQPPFVILTFSYRGLITHFSRFARFAMSSVNNISVITKFELSYYPKVLEFPGERISFCPLGWYDSKMMSSNQNEAPERFLLSSGRSYRDYDTMVKALESLNVKAILIARKFNLKGIHLPDNVRTMDLIPREEFWQLLNHAQFVVVPLQKLPHSAGESVIIQAMSAGKAVIATQDPGSDTYIEHGVTGLLVPPNNVEALRKAISFLWENPQKALQMGLEARKRYEAEYTFEAFAARVDEILVKACNEYRP